MKRHIWFPFLTGTRCVVCERPKITEYVLTPCPGSAPEDPAPAEPARPVPASPALEPA